jgi:hypothetical protein
MAKSSKGKGKGRRKKTMTKVTRSTRASAFCRPGIHSLLRSLISLVLFIFHQEGVS